ncbi:hypothetical protein O9993_03295 [Vibrio lentus]|nr:hypothetical protein [Vibrio lentus]
MWLKKLGNVGDLRDRAIHLLIPELQHSIVSFVPSNSTELSKRYKALMGNSPLADKSVGLFEPYCR